MVNDKGEWSALVEGQYGGADNSNVSTTLSKGKNGRLKGMDWVIAGLLASILLVVTVCYFWSNKGDHHEIIGGTNKNYGDISDSEYVCMKLAPIIANSFRDSNIEELNMLRATTYFTDLTKYYEVGGIDELGGKSPGILQVAYMCNKMIDGTAKQTNIEEFMNKLKNAKSADDVKLSEMKLPRIYDDSKLTKQERQVMSDLRKAMFSYNKNEPIMDKKDVRSGYVNEDF